MSDCPFEPDSEDVQEDLKRRLTVREIHYMAKKAAAKKTAKKSTTTTKPLASGKSDKEFLDRMRKKQEAAKRSQAGDFWKPADGRNVIRPFTFEHKGEKELFVTQTLHWALDGNLKGKENVACSGDDCPICALKEELSDKDWQKIRPQTKYLMNCVVRGENKQVIAQLPKKCYTQILSYVTGEDPDVVDCLDHKKGCDFKIARQGEGLETQYTVIPMGTASPIGVDVKPVDLYERLKKPPTDEQMEQYAEAIKQWSN